MAKIERQVEQTKSVRDPSQTGFLLKENHIYSNHITLQRVYQNMVRIESIETSLNKLEKTLNEHLKKQFTHPAEF